MNNVCLIGRIVRDLELENKEGTNSRCKFTLAVDRNGTESTDFINCIAWGKVAENLTKYQKKGNQISIVGSIRADSYQNKDGNNVYITEVVADKITFLDKKDSNNNN